MRRYDLVIAEGAGSPAAINLRQGDIANMGFAEAADVPVVLCGDIDGGGVIAQIIGTQAVMPAADADQIKGFILNKFRGDPALFDDGYAAITQMTGWCGYGVSPWFADAWRLPEEDALDIADTPRREGFHIVCLRLSRIANFDDLDPLSDEANVRATMLPSGQPIPADADLFILPGSKSTRGDLAFLRAQGWDIDLSAYHRRGGHVLGICGGYQMLGNCVSDPMGIEGILLDCVIIDELGYIPFPKSGGALLFHLPLSKCMHSPAGQRISKLYEKTSVIITTNLKFGEWVAVFGPSHRNFVSTAGQRMPR